METVKKQSLIAQVTDQLRAEIVAGNWAVGERIPTEPTLCEITGTARNTVREAVGSLVHAGLLERRQGSGTYVIAVDEREVAFGDYFAAAQRRDLLELREALEVAAAAFAAQRRDDADIAQLREVLSRRNDLWREPVTSTAARHEAIAADAQLHRTVVAASHNEVYLKFYDSLLPALRQSIAVRPVDVTRSYEHAHTALVEAVIAGDAAPAADAARDLLRCIGSADE